MSKILNRQVSMVERIRPLEYWQQSDKLPFDGVDVKFYDDFWDFLPINYLHQSRRFYEYNFNDLNVCYVDYVKGYFIKRYNINGDAFSTLNESQRKTKRFIEFLIDQRVYKPKFITLTIVEKYLSYVLIDDNLEETKNAYYEHLKDFLVYLNACNEELEYSSIYRWLRSQRNDFKRSKQREASKTSSIHPLYLDKLIQCAIQDINDLKVSDSEKMEAAIVLLLSQIGCRIGELRLIQADSLNEEVIFDDIVVKYLTFITFKTVKEKEYRITETYMNSHALLAYKTLVEINPIKNALSENHYVFNNSDTNVPISKVHLREKIKKFVIRHYEELNSLGIDKNEFEKYGTAKARHTYTGSGLYIRKKYRNKIGHEERFVYPKPHQFRVAVVNGLADNENVSLDMIREHMNHLTSDMTQHYIRREMKKENIRNYTSKMLAELSINAEKNKDVLKQTLSNSIASFINKDVDNVRFDVEEIIVEAKGQLALTDNNLGYCLYNPLDMICDLVKLENIGYNSEEYYKPHFTYIDKSYSTFKSKVKLVNYNKSHGFRVQSEIEVKKLKKHIETKLLPEYSDLKENIDKVGGKKLAKNNPKIARFIINMKSIEKEINEWMKI